MVFGAMERFPNRNMINMMWDLKLSKVPKLGKFLYGSFHSDSINSEEKLSNVLHMTSGNGHNRHAHNSTQ